MREYIDIVSEGFLNEAHPLEPTGAKLSRFILNARNRFGEDRLSGGNSGMFALALAACMVKVRAPVKIAVLFKALPHGVERSLKAVIDNQCDVYHVVVCFHEAMYDGSGIVRNSSLLRIAETHGDLDPMILTDLSPTDPLLITLIKTETRWTIAPEQFAEAMLKQ